MNRCHPSLSSTPPVVSCAFGRIAPVLAVFAAGAAQALTVTNSVPFTLGPNESASELLAPQFDPTASADAPTLIGITVAVEVQFSADLSLFGASAADAVVSWNLGPGFVRVVPESPELEVPEMVDLALTGVTEVFGGRPSPVTPAPTVTVTNEVTISTNQWTAYLGTNALAYTVDFIAPYTFVNTAPSSAGALYANDRVSGRLKVLYFAQSTRLVLSFQLGSLEGAGALVIQGGAGAEVVVETTNDVANGPWNPLATRVLDSHGLAQITLGSLGATSGQFFRAYQP